MKQLAGWETRKVKEIEVRQCVRTEHSRSPIHWSVSIQAATATIGSPKSIGTHRQGLVELAGIEPATS